MEKFNTRDGDLIRIESKTQPNRWDSVLEGAVSEEFPGKISGGGVRQGWSGEERRSRLMDQVRDALRGRHYSRRTEQAYRRWIKRFVYFHKIRHPNEMGEREINAFLTHLALKEKVSSSTQNQALAALLFLYR